MIEYSLRDTARIDKYCTRGHGVALTKHLLTELPRLCNRLIDSVIPSLGEASYHFSGQSTIHFPGARRSQHAVDRRGRRATVC